MAVTTLEVQVLERIEKQVRSYWQGSGWRGNLLLMLPFLSIYYAFLSQHEVWRDEINAWAIAFVSPNLADLLSRMHYEAHPALWYVILFAASRITQALWMLKLVQALVGTAIYLMLALTTPFRRFELALIYSGYYIAFQYTVMCRMYGLEVLFALVYIWFRMNRPHWIIRNVLWLGLMANVDLTASILACGLLLEYMLDVYKRRRSEFRPALRPIAAALLLFAAAEALALLSLWPAKDISWTSTGHLFSYLGDPLHLGFCTALWAGIAWYPQMISPVLLWPDMNFWPQGFWVTPILVVYFLVFRGHRATGRMFFVTVLGGIVFSHLTNVAGVRHIGVVYLAFLMALWMMRFRGEAVSRWAYLLLGAAVLASYATLAAQWGRPFTDAGAAAAWIRNQKLEEMHIMGTQDTSVMSVAERLNRPLYQLDCDCTDRVMVFHRRRDSYSSDQNDKYRAVAEKVALGLENLHTSRALLVLNFPLPADQQQALRQREIHADLAAQFDRGLLPDEHFYIYQVASARDVSIN
jgi:hypothetical protein